MDKTVQFIKGSQPLPSRWANEPPTAQPEQPTTSSASAGAETSWEPSSVQFIRGSQPLPSRWANEPPTAQSTLPPTSPPKTHSRPPKRRPRRRSHRKPRDVAPAASLASAGEPTSSGSAISQSTIDFDEFDWADEA